MRVQEDPRNKPLTLQLMEECFYQLSHICPKQRLQPLDGETVLILFPIKYDELAKEKRLKV